MKKNKKLNSIATMSKKELQEVNGGNMYYMLKYYPRVLVEGQPNPMAIKTKMYDLPGQLAEYKYL